MKLQDIKIKRAELDILGKLYENLEDMLNYSPFTRYECVGKSDRQSTDWRTGELLWEDEEQTIPKFENKYADIAVPEEQYDDMRARKVAIMNVLSKLEKLL